MGDLDIVSLFSQFLFPSAAYVGLFWWMIKSNEIHREEVKELTSAIERNTETQARLAVMIDERLPKA